MSTVKISQLPLLPSIAANTSNTIFLGVDIPTGVTGRLTATTLAQQLYANNILNVGKSIVSLPNTIAQFSLSGASYIQTNLLNVDNGGTADIVVTANTGTDSTYFIDLGLANKDFQPGLEYNNLGTGIYPLDGYLYVQGGAIGSPGGPGGNLTIGTTTANTEVKFLLGGPNSSNIIYKITHDGLKFVNGHKIFFDDGTSQNTAAASLAYTQAAFNQANTVTANLSSNVTLQAAINATQNTDITNVTNNLASNVTLQAAINATQNTNISNVATNLSSNVTLQAAINATQNTDITNVTNNLASNVTLQFGINASQNAYTQAAFTKANNALANTSGAIFAGNLNILGNVTMLGVASTGQLTVNTALTSATDAAVRITGSNNAVVVEPQNDGYMLQITGKENLPTRVVLDSFGANTYGLLAGRSARGTAAAPTASQNNDVLLRLAGNGYGTTSFAPIGVSRIDIVASENFTDTARGSRIEFYNVAEGSNTVTKIASFNANSSQFLGSVEPEKGFIYRPTILQGAQTAFTIDFSTTSLIKATLTADLTIALSNYVQGKVVEVWLTNTGGTNRTVTHGCTATNSSENSATFTISATSSAHLKYFSIGGDNANTFVAVQHG
jgi:hypothetical protein